MYYNIFGRNDVYTAEQRDEFLKKLKFENNENETQEDDDIEKFFEGLKDLPDKGNVF